MKPWRSTAVAFAVTVSVVSLAAVFHHHYPIGDWIFWKYAKAATWAVAWLTSCVVAGLAVVERLVPGLPLRERLVQGAAVGVYGFYVIEFLGGLLGLFGPIWSVLLPSAMLLFGVATAETTLLELWRTRDTRRFTFGVAAPWQAPLVALAILAVGWLYLGLMNPGNAAFDAQWYHLGLGQGWAADGGIRRSPEGWFVEALPNMAAVLYSWAFLLPGLDVFEIAMVVAHMELLLLLVTLASIPVLVEWLLPDTNTGFAWVALFLFPSIFVYDAGLHSGNDHVAAFWAVPIFLALRRAWTSLDWRNMTLLAMVCAGAILTKYQAASLVVGPVLFVLGRGAYLAVKRRDDRRWVAGLGVSFVAGLVFTSPLWAKNWIWYGDPFYPALYRHLTLHPWNEEMDTLMQQNWSRLVRRPEGPLWRQLGETFVAGLTFGFRSYTAGRFHGHWPYFGSLFTLTALWLPFVKGSKRTWALFAAAQVGVFVWYYLSHVERYLQALVPWMACVVAAALVLAWRTGWLARLPVIGLVALQLVWGGDAPFFRAHAMLGELPVVGTARLLEGGFKGNTAARRNSFGSIQRVGDALPDGAVVLEHDLSPRAGIRARVITDHAGFQGKIRYGLLGSPGEVYDLYDELGVTHIAWLNRRSKGFDTLAGELRFVEFVNNWVENPRNVGSIRYGTMPAERPARGGSDVVLYGGCGKTIRPGFHHLGELNILPGDSRVRVPFEPMPKDRTALREAFDQVDFVVTNAKCATGLRSRPTGGFVNATTRPGGDQIWVRRR